MFEFDPLSAHNEALLLFTLSSQMPGVPNWRGKKNGRKGGGGVFSFQRCAKLVVLWHLFFVLLFVYLHFLCAKSHASQVGLRRACAESSQLRRRVHKYSPKI